MSQPDQQKIDRFVTQLKTSFSGHVNSIVLYGSAVTGDFQEKTSDLNFLVVLDETVISQIDKVQKYLPEWKRMKIAIPLFVTQKYLDASLDVFPIEFLNMQKAYRVIEGEDVLSALKFDNHHLRMQCERELKGKLLQLRQGYIQTLGKSGLMKNLIAQSVTTFTSIFAALLFLKKHDIPKLKNEIILAACHEFSEIEESLFIELLNIKNGSAKLSKDELNEHLKIYILQIQNLSQSVDQMTV